MRLVALAYRSLIPLVCGEEWVSFSTPQAAVFFSLLGGVA